MVNLEYFLATVVHTVCIASFCVNAQYSCYKLKPTNSPNIRNKFHSGQSAIVKMASERVPTLAEIATS